MNALGSSALILIFLGGFSFFLDDALLGFDLVDFSEVFCVSLWDFLFALDLALAGAQRQTIATVIATRRFVHL